MPYMNNVQLTEIFFYGKENIDNMNNANMLDAAIRYLIETKRFDAQLFYNPGCYCLNTDVVFKI